MTKKFSIGYVPNPYLRRGLLVVTFPVVLLAVIALAACYTMMEAGKAVWAFVRDEVVPNVRAFVPAYRDAWRGPLDS